MADSLIPYDEIVQDALRGAVRTILERTARGGLPGEHHFYIAFRTKHPGVRIPKHLLETYPEEMTIVIQHRYWELTVEEDWFEIGLSFNQVPARLKIPFAAIVGFVDPAVNFALQFQVQGEATLLAEEDAPTPAEVRSLSPAARQAAGTDASETGDGERDGGEGGGAKVVTLDAFRKK